MQPDVRGALLREFGLSEDGTDAPISKDVFSGHRAYAAVNCGRASRRLSR
jgi:hypothetical protein